MTLSCYGSFPTIESFSVYLYMLVVTHLVYVDKQILVRNLLWYWNLLSMTASPLALCMWEDTNPCNNTGPTSK